MTVLNKNGLFNFVQTLQIPIFMPVVKMENISPRYHVSPSQRSIISNNYNSHEISIRLILNSTQDQV